MGANTAKSGKRMDGAARRAHLLVTARQRFAEDGYHATTMSSIAREAGVSEPLLFKHFESKEALFRLSIVEPLLELLRSHTDSQASGGGSVASHEQAMRRFLVAWASLVRQERGLAMTFLAELHRFPDVAVELAEMLRAHVDDIADRNARTTARPEYRRFDPVVATWSGIATATAAGLVADDLDKFVEEYLEILLYGIRAS